LSRITDKAAKNKIITNIVQQTRRWRNKLFIQLLGFSLLIRSDYFKQKILQIRNKKVARQSNCTKKREDQQKQQHKKKQIRFIYCLW
jgi:hypothetical protein